MGWGRGDRVASAPCLPLVVTMLGSASQVGTEGAVGG